MSDLPGTKRSVLEELGLTPVINANGAASRLGGNTLSPAALEAMIEASQRVVPLHELQSRASETIEERTAGTALWRELSRRKGR